MPDDPTSTDPTNVSPAAGDGTPTPQASSPAAPPQPTYVTREELAQQGETLLGRIAGMLDGFRAAAAPVAPAAAPVPQVDLREIDQMIREGREGSAERVAQYVQQEVRRGVASAIRDEVTPLRTYGLSALQQMAKKSALGDDPVAKRYASEIEAEVNRLPEEMKGNPMAWQNALDLVAGRHRHDIVAEATEAAVRRESDRRPDPAQAARSAQLIDDKGAKLPSIEEFAGTEGMAALRAKNITDGDQLAQRMGYASWKEYVIAARDADSLEEKY